MRWAALLAIAVTGCQTTPPPEVVHVTVREYVPVPEELTAPCDEHPAREQTYGEAIRVANARLASVRKCNADKAAIRALGEEVEEGQ